MPSPDHKLHQVLVRRARSGDAAAYAAMGAQTEIMRAHKLTGEALDMLAESHAHHTIEE